MDAVAENLRRIEQRIAAAAQHAGRRRDEITLVAVTKTVPPERIAEAIAAGQTVFGESRLQEARAKIPAVSGRARWHMVGHLQTNKVRDAVALFELIHSVDSLRLALEIDKWAARLGKTQAVLLEVNVAGEAQKFGFKPEELPSALSQIARLPRVEVQGLMTVAPLVDDPEQVRPVFRRLRELRDALQLRHLSMGMSNDFEVAIAEGATMVRIGTAIFGERSNHESETAV